MSRARKGVAAVEMALIAPVFFLMLTGLVEMALFLTTQQLLENAAFNASRLAKTGYVATGQTQMQSVTQILNTELQSFGTLINTANVTMTSTSYTSFTSSAMGVGGVGGLGTAQQIVVYTITYPWKFFTPMVGALMGTKNSQGDWIVNLTSQIVVRNEPYG